jgi:hypothetical protein
MKKNIELQKIKETLEKNQKGYFLEEKNLFYLSDKIRIYTLSELRKIEVLDVCLIEKVYFIDDVEVPTKLAFSLKKQYGDSVINLLLVRIDKNWFELWIEEMKG